MTDLKEINEAWLGLDVSDEELFNPMEMLDPNDENYHLKLSWLMVRPEYFSFLCKQVFNIQILPSQAHMLHEMWNRRFPMLIASRGFGKSFILSLYAMMRALLLPNRKVVIVGAAFRQSKVLFEYMETIWYNSPILRDICDSSSGPRRDVDRCVMRINDSRVTCLPLGDGQKIRGQRANDIISDEFASIPRDIFETVVAGFAAVSADPIDNVRRIASQKKAEELGISLESEKDSVANNKDNQIILSGTAISIDEIIPFCKREKIKCIPLPVSGAFHCNLMKSASDSLLKTLNQLNLEDSMMPIYQNINALPESSNEKLRENLKKQIISTVKWKQTIDNMVKDNALKFIEVGPKKILTSLLKKSHPDIKCLSFEELIQGE